MARRDRSPSMLSTGHQAPSPDSYAPSITSDSAFWSTSPSTGPFARNVRKRHSFFGRTQSDASSMRRGPPLRNAMSPQSSSGSTSPPRPPTVASETRRRKTDPLRGMRDSWFGARKKSTGKTAGETQPSFESRPSSRNAPAAMQEPESLRHHFDSEEDYYRYQRKASISPPFDFQHVTHTARDQLPRLQTVEERDLPGEFWSTAAYQAPRRHLNGIQADDVGEKLRDMGVSRGSPSSRPTSPTPAEAGKDRSYLTGTSGMVSSIDETMFDERRETNFDPDGALQRLHTPTQSPPRFPKRYSSLGALPRETQSEPRWDSTPPTLQLRSLSPLPDSSTFFNDSRSSSDNEMSPKVSPRQRPMIDAKDSLLALDSVEEESEPCPSRRQSRHSASIYSSDAQQQPLGPPAKLPSTEPSAFAKRTSYNIPALSADPSHDTTRVRPGTEPNEELGKVSSAPSEPPRQPLPPLPPQALAKKSSSASLKGGNIKSVAVMSITAALDRPASTKSSRSKRSSRSTKQSPATAATPSSENRASSRISGATWEDDVDFCYEQEAEATCDFDWRSVTPSRALSIAESDGGVRLSAWMAPSPSSTVSHGTDRIHGWAGDDIVSQPAAAVDPQAQHKRGSSVGHRGFLAARRGSGEVKRFAAPPALELSSGSTQVSVLSPVFSVAEDGPRTPFTPATLDLKDAVAAVADAHRLSTEYLSDPESIRTGGSKHRKSSSYGSYESMSRPAAAAAAAAAPHGMARDAAARWSLASSTSVPDLMHSSKRRSKASLHKSLISRPLESLPQSPGSGPEDDPLREGEASSIVPRSSQVEPMRNTFVLRRSQNPDDGGEAQVVRTATGRGRPPTPSRFSRLLDGQEHKVPVTAIEAAEAGWI